MQRYIVLILMLITGILYGVDLRPIDLQSAKEMALRQNQQYQSAEADFLKAKWGKTNALSAAPFGCEFHIWSFDLECSDSDRDPGDISMVGSFFGKWGLTRLSEHSKFSDAIECKTKE